MEEDGLLSRGSSSQSAEQRRQQLLLERDAGLTKPGLLQINDREVVDWGGGRGGGVAVKGDERFGGKQERRGVPQTRVDQREYPQHRLRGRSERRQLLQQRHQQQPQGRAKVRVGESTFDAGLGSDRKSVV